MPSRTASSVLLAAALLASLAAWCGPSARAQDAVLTTLHSFAANEGASPYGGLTQGSDGNFYGTTEQGGSSGVGTVFKMTPAGSVTVLHLFTGDDGANPQTSLIQTTDGSFYGTTTFHGPGGGGTVFKITPDGTLTTLHGFDSKSFTHPSGLTPGLDGNFYGTLSNAVFSVTPDGTVTILHTLTSTEGEFPLGLARGVDGNFYGSTFSGGTNDKGTIFQVTPGGTFKVLYNLPYDNPSPTALVAGSDGNFYGVTQGNLATTTQAQFSSLRPRGFARSCTLSAPSPTFTVTTVTVRCPVPLFSRPAMATSTGSTFRGGANNSGTLFRCTPSGVLTTLPQALALRTPLRTTTLAVPDGAHPLAPLTQGSDGNLNGSTAFGGDKDAGTVFALNLHGLTAFGASAYKASEAGGSVTLAVVRTSAAGAASVRFATLDDTALAGTDYTAASGTLTWAEGDVSSRTITVALLDHGLRDGSTRLFHVVLSDPVNTGLGAPASATVEIGENDLSPPVLTYVSNQSGVIGAPFT